MAGLLQEFAQAQLARDAAEQLARLEVDGARRGRRLSVGIFRDLGDVVAGIFLGIAVDRIVIKNGENFGHGGTPSWTDMDADIGTPLMKSNDPAATCRCRIGSRPGVKHAVRLILAFPHAGGRDGIALLGGCRQSELRSSRRPRSSRRFVTADRSALSIRLDLDKRAGG